MNHRQRALYVIVFLAFGFTLVSLRLVQIMLVDHEKYQDLAINNHLRRIELPPHRGAIVDSAFNTLAQTRIINDIYLDCQDLKDPEETLKQIASILELPADQLAKSYNPEARYLPLRKDVEEKMVVALRELKVRNLIFKETSVRSYPNGAHASHLIGFLGDDNRGASGIEKQMNSYLRGIPGELWIEKDRKGKEIAAYRRKDLQPVDGMQVALTIDLSIQHIIEDQLDKLVQKYQPAGAFVIVMRPRTGEILAMANRPTFDPNERRGAKPEQMRNRCITDTFEPGSTFKAVSIAAAINEGVVTLGTPIFCENGEFYYGGFTLHDHERYGMMTVREVIAKSSNIGTGKIALMLGQEKLFPYLQAFGFGRVTGILSRQGESAGILRPLSQWSKVSITRVPMGQGVAATPLQMISAMSAVANGGALMTPRIVKQVNDSEGRVVEIYSPRMVRQVIAPSTARMMTQSLEDVVSDQGTAQAASVPGFTVAGKTGTAQKFVNGEYSKEKYVASFIGYLPAENPQFVMLVMVDEPKGKQYYGGQVAAPAFAEMSKKIVQCLNLEPKKETAGVTQAKL
ncbi:MAG: hypothetical protein B9S32_02680 [Verrucomicrobia bacterium Tous-C9LFEB]|nr:MAG: hypothetical protein B9S32_02680 [Verrucomicrobia bacterium Tous-C9LFEB]